MLGVRLDKDTEKREELISFAAVRRSLGLDD